MARSRTPLRPTAIAFIGVLAAATLGCQGRSARRESDRVTAEAEARAQETTLTSAELESAPPASSARTASDDEMNAAFRLEQSDYRARLQMALDRLDRAVNRSRSRGSHELRTQRALLKADLDALDRSTEQDWATLRTKVERDLAADIRR